MQHSLEHRWPQPAKHGLPPCPAPPPCPQVYIPLPSAQHVEWVQKAAAKGLHIVLEKPLAANPEDLKAICQACDKYNVQLMDGTMWCVCAGIAGAGCMCQDSTLRRVFFWQCWLQVKLKPSSAVSLWPFGQDAQPPHAPDGVHHPQHPEVWPHCACQRHPDLQQ